MPHSSRLLTILPLAAVLSGAALAAPPTFRLTSPDLPPNKPIPARFEANAFGCNGPNESPALQWSGVPPGTRSFAITMYDTYPVPVSGWWHWIVYDLPPTTAAHIAYVISGKTLAKTSITRLYRR